MKKLLLLSGILLSLSLNSQNVGINTTGATPRDCAMLDIVSTTKGLLIPQVALTNVATYAPLTGTQVNGLLVYSTAAPTNGNGTGYYYWTGAAWANLIDNITPGAPWYTNGNTGTSSATNYVGTNDNISLVFRTNSIQRSVLFNDGTYIHTSAATGFDADELSAPNGMGVQVGALWTHNNAPAGNGTGYAPGAVNYSILGTINVTTPRQYSFGLVGQVGTDRRSGAVFGATGDISAWASLGYRNSANNYFGLYYSTTGNGTGFMRNSNIQTSIGSGGYGGVIGSWTRGEVMGTVAAGEMFASYNLGNEYTSGFQADIVTLSNKRVAAYPVTSTDIKVYNDGSSQLTNGKTRVKFETSFSELIGNNKPVVTVSPMGECKGIYISNVDATGFDVIELGNGNSNVDFSYIVIGKRIDSNNKPQLPESVAKMDFDQNMKGVMFNENNTEQSATPIWWDGSKIRFDNNMPEIPLEEIKKKWKQPSVKNESTTR